MLQAAICGITAALVFDVAWAVAGENLDPPIRYDHHPNMPVVINRAANPDILCKRWTRRYGLVYPKRHRFKACAGVIPKPTRCLMILPDGDVPFEIIRHEYAHCNGWPANHPR